MIDGWIEMEKKSEELTYRTADLYINAMADAEFM